MIVCNKLLRKWNAPIPVLTWNRYSPDQKQDSSALRQKYPLKALKHHDRWEYGMHYIKWHANWHIFMSCIVLDIPIGGCVHLNKDNISVWMQQFISADCLFNQIRQVFHHFVLFVIKSSYFKLLKLFIQ